MAKQLTYPFLPTAQSISALPPELQAIGQPQVVRSPEVNPMPVNLPELELPTVPPQKEPGLFEKLGDTFAPKGTQDIETTMALLRFAGDVMQPVSPGQTQAGILGNALAGAADTFSKMRRSEQDVEQKKAELGEAKRQDEEVNPVEQSLIDYRKAMGAAAEETAKAKGMTEAQYKALTKQQLLKDIMTEYPGLTESQANLAITMGEAVDFVNFPSIAKSVASVKLAENMSFRPEDVTENLSANTQIGGTGVQPYDPDAIADLFSTSDASMLKVDADPQLKANAINLVGQEMYDRRMKAIKGKK